jgi:hypothetical protein
MVFVVCEKKKYIKKEGSGEECDREGDENGMQRMALDAGFAFHVAGVSA